MRRRLRPARPSLYWTGAAGLALVTALVVGGLVSRAESARRRWGDAEAVAVAVRTLHPGDVVTGDDVTITSWPSGLAPDHALADAPVGRVVTAVVFAGEALVQDRLAPDGLTGVAALVPPGGRALAVPLPTGLHVEVGDLVDVLVSLDPALAGDDEPSFPVAEAAIVVSVAVESVMIAVPADDAPRVAFALAQGVVTIALRGA